MQTDFHSLYMMFHQMRRLSLETWTRKKDHTKPTTFRLW